MAADVVIRSAGGCDTTTLEALRMLVVLAGGGLVWGLLMAAVVFHFVKHAHDPTIE